MWRIGVVRKCNIIERGCFFKEEEGIRDYKVNGVKKCDIKIYISGDISDPKFSVAD